VLNNSESETFWKGIIYERLVHKVFSSDNCVDEALYNK